MIGTVADADRSASESLESLGSFVRCIFASLLLVVVLLSLSTIPSLTPTQVLGVFPGRRNTMANALCGPSNALQSFQKQASVDRTLQQDRITARQAPAEVCHDAANLFEGDLSRYV